MTDGMLAREALERKEEWAFLAEEVGRLLASSAEFRGRCRGTLGGGRGFREFELDLRGALLAGAAAGASEVLSELDAEFEAPACGRCGAAMNRRGTRAAAPLSLLGPLSLRRGYWTCRCSKGGLHVLDRALGIAGRDGVRLTPAALWALAELAAETSFAKAAARLGRLAGAGATAKRAERCAKQVGREIAAWDEAAAALVEAPAETMYCSPDGTGVPVVRRDAGTGEDGRPSKTREAQVAVFHTAERKDPKTGRHLHRGRLARPGAALGSRTRRARHRHGAVPDLVGEGLRGAPRGARRRRAGGTAPPRRRQDRRPMRRIRREQPQPDALPRVPGAGVG